MKPVRMCVVGVGNMGTSHCQGFARGDVPGAELAAVCDTNPERLKWARQELGEKVRCFESAEAMFAASDAFDALVVATPHYDHVALCLEGLKRDKHVLCEKPIGVFTKNVRELNEYVKTAEPVFGIMLNNRTHECFQKIRQLVRDGELGAIKRVIYIVTGWYRSQSYYNSGGWRATWAGEGGGVLLNQCPHQLDLWQWICGMPKRVRASMYYGKYHDIEVEDDVTAYVEYDGGAVGTFIASTHETPGTNRLEISCDRGKLIYEGGEITFWRNVVPEREFNRTYTGGFGNPEVWECKIKAGGGENHKGIFKNWVHVIQTGDKSKLLAPGAEGINGLTLSNAMMLSDWTGNWVDLPLDEDLFYNKLQERIAASASAKDVSSNRTMSTEGTFVA